MGLLHIFNPFGSAVTTVFALVLAALFGLVALRLRFLKRRNDTLSDLLAGWKKRHVEPHFESAEDLRALEGELKGRELGPLAHPLSEFREATFSERHDGRPLHIYPAEHFITPERFRDGLLSEGKRRIDLGPGLLDAIPGLFTAIGILGTFVGLVLGLTETGANGMPDAERLVGGLHVSFKSSIYGLLASLASTFWLRSLDSRISRTVAELTDWLDAKMERGTEHALLVELLREQRQATSALKTLKDDLREAFQQAVNETLVPVVEKAMDGRSETQLAGVGKIVDGVLANLGSQLENAASRFDDAAERTRVAGEWWDHVSKQLTQLTSQQQQLAELVNRSLQPMSEAATQLSQAASASTRAGQHMEGAAKETREGLQSLTSQLGQTLSAAQEALERMESVRTAWSDAAGTLRLAGTELNEGFSIFAGQFPKAIETTMTEFDKELAGVAQRLASVGNDLQETFDEVRAALEAVLRSAKGR